MENKSMRKLMEEFPLNIDDYVTIVDRKPYQDRVVGGPFDTKVVPGVVDKSWWGDVLQVKVINEPYVLCEKRSKYSHSDGDVVQLDLREVTLMKLTDEYVELATRKDAE